MEPLFFSVVIPTYNRPRRLSQCLDSLTHLDYPSESFEVIVVDDGSDAAIELPPGRYEGCINVRVLRQQNAGPAAARNRGAREAAGEYVVFTDDDCQPLTDWLSEFLISFKQHPEAGIGGHVLNGLIDNPWAASSQSLVDYLYGYFNADFLNARMLTSNNLAFPRNQFLQMGGFDTNFPLAAAEDRELCHRWTESGRQLLYAPNVKVQHKHGLTFRSFWRQHFNYGRGAWQFHRKCSQETGASIKVEPCRFYIDLLKHAAKNPTAGNRLQSLSIMILSQLANGLGFFAAALFRNHRKC